MQLTEIEKGAHADWRTRGSQILFGGRRAESAVARPGHDQKSLAAAAIGDPRLDSLPPAHVNFAVAVTIGLAAAWPLVAPLLHFPGLMLLGNLFLAAVFLARGMVGYAPFFRRRHSLQPFAKFNRWFYSPLCLVLGMGFLYLAGGESRVLTASHRRVESVHC
jgi:hypothetical protein